MQILVLLIGALMLYFALSKYLNKQPEKFNDIFRKVLAVIFGVVGFFILIKGNISVAVVLGTAAVLSWQGSLWTYLQSKVKGPEVGDSGAKVTPLNANM
ncbi:MAG: hypothetical protein HOH19_11895, partial [Kordiimonadaceae bacterium]|nr:hypothetical protein [Kordiimonadaceae bacterium]